MSGIPDDSHTIGASCRAEGDIDHNRQIEGIGDELSHDGQIWSAVAIGR